MELCDILQRRRITTVKLHLRERESETNRFLSNLVERIGCNLDVLVPCLAAGRTAIEFDFNGVTTTPTDRLLIGATTGVAGRPVRVFNTHLLAFFMLKSSSETNLEQRQLVAKQLRASTGPTVLGGDFNVSKHDSLVRQFARAGYKTVQTKEITWRRRPYVLDHIFYSGHLKPVRHVVKPTLASDHHALVAEFRFAD